jgi:hypothetical protein
MLLHVRWHGANLGGVRARIGLRDLFPARRFAVCKNDKDMGRS